MQDHTVPQRAPWAPTRRQVLSAGAAGAAALGASSLRSTRAWAGSTAGVGPVRGPFSLGVASGDPLPDCVVLWTRLAPEPLAEGGLGGMPNRIVPVQWEVSDRIYELREFNGGDLIIGGSLYPIIAMTCKSCGATDCRRSAFTICGRCRAMNRSAASATRLETRSTADSISQLIR